MPRYNFKLSCPVCLKEADTTTDKRTPPPHVNCGDCLFDYTEIVEMTVVEVEEIEP